MRLAQDAADKLRDVRRARRDRFVRQIRRQVVGQRQSALVPQIGRLLQALERDHFEIDAPVLIDAVREFVERH